ncbi:MAG: hypothetical protein OMM_05885 [Candidatus Magnetoglobus multicellularis str. Araruama]|uniref:MalT-like TPR region domain-containing protein n=1 Tax=Candidatus Magnetoglobus multicellularis str. Araruama TaxID=890399 RepID=A0A1V1NTI0_9BACT|nr:MAG: hypothetical protein OMM_05885 [Candidatus Magnetoglobus multicellularis str. Araruama]
MIRRLIEIIFSITNPLAKKQAEAIKLQDTYGSWPVYFYHQLSENQINRVKNNKFIKKAENLYREVLEEGEDSLSPGAIITTKHQLALLLHRQGRIDEATDLYNEVIKTCRLYTMPTETCDWALCFALFRLAELTFESDRNKAIKMFAESSEISNRRKYVEGISLNKEAKNYFQFN